MGAIWRGQFEGNSYIGLFARASDSVVLVPNGAPQKFIDGMGALACPTMLRASVDGSPFLGIFIAMNSNGAVVPKMMADEETAVLKKAGLNVYQLEGGDYSAAGNNVACNDHGALVNPDMPERLAKKISEVLGVEMQQHTLGGSKTVGMACVATNKGFVAHNRISEEEAAMLESLFNCKGQNGTVNSGTAHVGAGISATSRGAAVGEASSGFEVGRIIQALDLV